MKIIEEKDFKGEIEEGLVLVDFFANWCGPCRMLSPILEEFADLDKDVKVIKLNVDDCENVAREYAVMSIPTLILFKDGVMVDKNVGLLQIEGLKNFVKKHK